MRSHFAWTFPLKLERSDQAKASRCLATKASTVSGGPSDLFDEIVGPGEHPVRVVDGDLAQVLHQELAAGPAGNPVGFGIK